MINRRLRVAALAAFLAGSAAATELTVRGDRFCLDGTPVFLLGCSYYAALGAPDDVVRRDLDEMRRLGFNWVRVWATWAAFDNDVSAVDCEGRGREPFLARLRQLVAGCDRRGMAVDVTLSRGNGVTGPPRLGSLEVHRRAAETLVNALKPFRNWYLDLANERNIRDKRFVSYDELKELREACKAVDPDRLVTASFSGDIPAGQLRDYLLEVRVDFIAPHRLRNATSPVETEAKTREYRAAMKAHGRVVPVHYQEPFRRGFGRWQPMMQDFLADLRGARAGGAAGWCFHNGDQRDDPRRAPRRSFDLREKRLFEQLDEEEQKFLAALEARRPVTPHPPRP
jgi:endo-1,4-beta-mannosidase